MDKSLQSVLVIEDDMSTRDMISRLLSGEGYTVKLAANGWEALLALEGHVDVVLLDIMLPGMDGYGFLRSLRHQAGNNRMPVVVFTALDEQEVREKVRKFGVEDVIGKGEHLFPQLKAAMKRHLARFEKGPPGDPAPQPGTMVRPFLDEYMKGLGER